MIKYLFGIIALSVSVAGVAGVRDPRPLTAADRAAVSAAVTKKLDNPRSARFKWLPMTGTFQDYCGYVNAKDRSGSYIGFTPFHAQIIVGAYLKVKGAALIGMGDGDPESKETRVTVQMCRNAGININGSPSD